MKPFIKDPTKHSMIKKHPTLFIDRDGTLIEEPSVDFQVDSLEKLIYEPQVVPVLLALQAFGYRLVMVTNQDGLGTDSFPKADFDAPHQAMMRLFTSQGIIFDHILICPHFERDQCCCRKPKLGLVSQYLQQGLIDFERSYVIGDRITDVQLANNMGIQSIQYHQQQRDWPSILKTLTRGDRFATVERITNETSIGVQLNLDQYQPSQIHTGIGFFDHMLDQIAVHAGIELNIQITGDLEIDDHHSVEDCAIALGQALYQALGNKRGIERFGFTLPMDESSAKVLLDLSGRAFCVFETEFQRERLGTFSTEMVKHFFHSLADAMRCTLHIQAQGENDHHKIEAIFKAFGRTLKQCIARNHSALASSKGVLA
jgi:imidazoleglycerol-phosphate dehydratase/histidinol-phosphatase